MAKSRDLEVIKQLEEQIGRKLEQLDLYIISGKEYRKEYNGYAIDENGHVIGLNLFATGISDLSPLKELAHLILLNLYRNQISDLSPLKELTYLIELSLHNNQLSDISPLKGLKNLTTLDLSRNQISDLSPLKELTQVTKLELGGNQISDLSPLKELTQLTDLSLHSNQISDFSPLKELTQVTKLELGGNQISDISPLKELTQLTVLSLGSNQISDLSPLKELTQLTKLNLSYNKITDLSPLKKLIQLDELNLRENKISDLSPLRELINLTYLLLYNNQISDLSPLRELTKLTELLLYYNQISDLSPLKKLTNLKELVLSYNKISDISALDLKELTNLKKLELDNNILSHLPREIFGLNTSITLWGNPLKSPPMEIFEKGKEAVKAWFKSLEGETRALNEVKVLLVGDGGAGKTSLVKRLLEQGFDKNEPQTDGISINHWEVKLKKDKIKVNIWDFGGQEIMHATHQFFLTKRSLYILVLEGRKEKKIDHEYWLKHVKSFGGDSPVLVVINKIDENPGFDVNRLFLQEKYPNIKGFFRVSCSNGEGIKTFSQNLARELAKVELISNHWGENWFKVKTQLEQLKKEKKNFISYDDYNALCQKEKIYDTSGQDTLVGFLNDLGVVIHFKDFKLKETYVLEPEWVTTAVYKIINSREIADAMGLLKLNRLDEILKQKFPEDHYYPPDKYRFIIELMQKFELCYEMDGETLLIPDLLEVQQPVFNFDYNGALKFQVDYDFLPRSVMPRFIVKMHRDIKEDLHWHTGVVLKDKVHGCTAVVKSDDEAGKIYIYVQGDQKRYYFAVIRHTISDINSSFEKIEAKECVPLPDNPEISVSYKHLLWLEHQGIESYAVEDTQKLYDVRLLLGAVDKTVFNQLLTGVKKIFLSLEKKEPQKRGYDFEKFLEQLFTLFGLAPQGPFRNTGEQIDGSFQLGNDIFLLEAKWKKEPISKPDLVIFNDKVNSKPKWTRGLFVSISGFTAEAVKGFKLGRTTSIIGMDKQDLELILKGDISLEEAIRLELRHASETNDFYAPLEKLISLYHQAPPALTSIGIR